MHDQFSAILLTVYALLLIAGGLIGFYKAGSRASLIAGMASGLIALGAGIWSFFGGQGSLLGIVLGLALIGVFGSRLWKTRKFMPAGMLLAVSVLVVFLLASRSLL